MLTVIFGAGASFDSTRHRPPDKFPPTHPSYQYRPPLANQLFDDRGYFSQAIGKYWEVRALAHMLRDLPEHVLLEAELDRIRQESEGYPDRQQQLMAMRFYLADILGECGRNWWREVSGVTNYTWLVDVLNAWHYRTREGVRLITFNWDDLLDRSCWDQLHLRSEPINGYIERTDFQLLRPHGSVNWQRIAHPIGGGSFSDLHNLISRAAEIVETDEIVTIEAPAAKTALALVPAVAIPLTTKTTFEMPRDHVDALKRCVTETTRLLVIGWRATEHHFLDMWKDHAANIKSGLVISGSRSGAEATVRNLVTAGFPPLGIAEGGFSASTRSGELERTLLLK